MTGPVPNFSGFPGLSGSPSANDIYAQRLGLLTSGGGDTFSLSSPQPEKQSKGFLGAVKDVGKGILNGALNTVKSLFTWQGLAMTLGTAGLIAAFGAPVVMPFLIAGGALAGGYQMLGGLMKGDWQKVGEGIFTLGATGVGAKYGPKEFTAKDGQFSIAKIVKNQDGVTQAVKPTGIWDSTLAYLKAPFRGFGRVEGDNIVLTTEGKLANPKGIISAAGDNFQATSASLKQKLDRKTKSAEPVTPEESTTPSPEKAKSNPVNSTADDGIDDVFHDAVESQSVADSNIGSKTQTVNNAKKDPVNSDNNRVADVQGDIDDSGIDSKSDKTGFFKQDGLPGAFGTQAAITGALTN